MSSEPATVSPDELGSVAPQGVPPLRFSVEVLAWVATPMALWPVSPVLAVAAVLLLIGLPTVFSTPGDKRHVIVAVPGLVTIGLVLLQLGAAVVCSWVAWYPGAALVTTVLAVITAVTELGRWRWLLAH